MSAEDLGVVMYRGTGLDHIHLMAVALEVKSRAEQSCHYGSQEPIPGLFLLLMTLEQPARRANASPGVTLAGLSPPFGNTCLSLSQ